MQEKERQFTLCERRLSLFKRMKQGFDQLGIKALYSLLLLLLQLFYFISIFNIYFNLIHTKFN
jgi:hypothetical protein